MTYLRKSVPDPTGNQVACQTRHGACQTVMAINCAEDVGGFRTLIREKS